ncbi:MAG: TRAP transporter substrate-binding protein [Vallitaleaceae bacterium]|jgi:tripartite ATP-independent transporter DctP family solute receptor|nr:TRAP transporter substrate-binding protein [Vallitaleaceae bacterium]
MMNKKLMVWLILLITISLILQGCSSEQKNLKDTYSQTFRLAESHPSDHPTAKADVEFAKRVEEETDGRIKIVVYFDKSLGEEKDVTKEVQFGAIDFSRVSIAPMADIVPEMYVLQLPFLYADREHMWRVLNSEIGDYMIDAAAEHGFIGLTWFDAGARSFYTIDKPITKMEDLEGMSIRLQENKLMQDMADAMNFIGEGRPYGEVFSLLQQHEVDGAENNFSSYLTASHYQVAKYYTMDEHQRVPELIIASEEARASISDEDWAIIMSVAKETTEYQKQLWEEMEIEAKEKLVSEGVIMLEPDDRQSFVDAVAPIHEKYAEEYGDLIQQIKAMAYEN